MNAKVQTQGIPRLTSFQLTSLVIVRILVGWHILYEGMVKLLSSNWSSAGFLMDSKWILADFFQSMAADPTTLSVVDTLNIWGLILIGLGLILGAFTRMASIAGALLLFFYYLSHPPLVGLSYALPSEGSYLIVNKTLIEAAVLLIMAAFPTGKYIGIDRIIDRIKGNPAPEETEKEAVA